MAAAGIRPGELVLDLGAGTGALTAPLVQAGARVVAVELHPGRAARLRERFAAEPGVRVVEADMTRLPLPSRPYRVVANPPYALRAQLLRRLTGPRSRMYAADVVLQRPVVKQVVARQNGQRGWTASVGLRVPRWGFQPPPSVDSAVLVLRRAEPVRPGI